MVVNASIRILGKCRPGKWLGCKAPLSSAALERVISSIPKFRDQGIVNLVIPGQTHTPLPPNSVRTFIEVLAHPRNSWIGMMHWRKLETIVLRRNVLEEAINSGHFRTGMDYAALVSALALQGLSTVDIDFIPGS